MLKKPEKSEYAEFQQKYILPVPDEVIPHLKEQKTVLSKYLDTVSEENLDYAYGPEKWSIREVVMHVIETEIIFNSRAVKTCRGEKQTLPGFNENAYVVRADMSHYSKEFLIRHFNATRDASLTLLESFKENQWMRVGNMSSYSMTLRSFPYMFAGHFDHHMRILKERYLL